ncbi:MAG: DUF3570 domain-containing protein [Alphaproteobacteria bacterium]|nr:DUF3570 domain-containing protein [Alphaproteobacteria bacterium]MDE2011783.1 DUF3570 domain-containing protein [Alphaproteobacteria bacterium]
MQLKTSKPAGHIRDTLATLSLGLIAANAAISPAAAQQSTDNTDATPGEVTLTLPYFEVGSAYLSYAESGGRVRATEPSVDFSYHASNGGVLTLGFQEDSVSGATPNGAAPADVAQSFVTPVQVKTSAATSSGGTGTTTVTTGFGDDTNVSGNGGEGGEGGGGGTTTGGTTTGGTTTGGTTTGSTTTVTVTTASGGSTIISVPSGSGTGGTTAVLGRQYTVPANTLPMDRGFQDQRFAGNIGWSQPLGPLSLAGVTLSYSKEHDYSSISGSASVAKDFNDHNTTLSFAVNYSSATSTPFGGVPTPLTVMNPQWKTVASRKKSDMDLVLGLTEVLTRRWILQANLSYGHSSGYQNDPYRIISQVDGVTGEPVDYLYESRPGSRTRESFYIDNKIDFDWVIPEVALRYYHDNWGISSETADISARFKLYRSLYVLPNVRFYQQSAANFFHYYLVNGQSLPAYASSDIRLGKFTAVTLGAQIGFNVTDNSEIYARAQIYQQTGDAHPAGMIGQLQNQNMFSGIKASWMMVGYTWSFN